MAQKCEYLDQCGFVRNFATSLESIKNSWVNLYCADIEVSELCERKKIRIQTGSPPPNNMAPTGKMI